MSAQGQVNLRGQTYMRPAFSDLLAALTEPEGWRKANAIMVRSAWRCSPVHEAKQCFASFQVIEAKLFLHQLVRCSDTQRASISAATV